MATGVQPRDEESNLTRADLDAIHDAMKCKKFRELLNEYCEEVRDPANQAIYQKEMVQLEKERGYDVKFINPKGGYVIKTSVAGDRKAFINICSNENMDKPTCSAQEVNGQKGMNWQLPYSIIPPREDIDHKKQRCVIYDVVFHPDTIRMAEVNKRFRELVNKTAFDGLQNTYGIHLDINNCRFPKSYYKGMTIPAVIRKEDPNYIPPNMGENQDLSPDLVEKLYPQQVYPKDEKPVEEKIGNLHKQHRKKAKNHKNEFAHSSESGYSIPKYAIKQQKNIDIQDYTYNKDSKQYSTIPSHLVVEINLPLLSSANGCTLDVREKTLNLVSEKPAKYKLDLTLPYAVNDECGSATFDKTKHLLIVTLPVITKSHSNGETFIRSDSGIDSENNSLDEEEPVRSLIEELNPITHELQLKLSSDNQKTHDDFLDATVGYTLPLYTFNVLDNIVAFTFHVKNTEPESVAVKNDDNKILIKFSTVGSGFVPIYFAAVISFNEDVGFENVVGEAWDNNVILQLELKDSIPHQFLIGLNEADMKHEHFDLSKVKKSKDCGSLSHTTPLRKENVPVVEVNNLRSETNIIVSINKNNTENDNKNGNNMWSDSNHSVSAAKSILRKPMSMMRSFSESSACDVASSMDYISSDCIPEESSLKKTVRFNDVIAKQFYRYNSSIEAQNRKNQRKKSKKRSQDRRRSESEAEEDMSTSIQKYKPRLKSVLKQRHDSGLADTSDAENECKTTMSDSDVPYDKIKYTERNDVFTKEVQSVLNIVDNNDNAIDTKPALWSKLDTAYSEKIKKQENSEAITCDNIKHNTDLYNPDKLNKGQYLEVTFKNDLIFDLDM